MTEVPIIDQPISAVAPVLHRDTINPTIPATQDAFVNSAEAFFDKISDTTVNEINQVTTKIDTTVAAINVVAQEISEATTIAIASGQYKGDWVAGFETTGYSLGDGITFTDGYNYVSKINNNLTTPITLTNTDQWNFIEAVNPNNYYLKTETYTKTEVDTLHEINNKTDKTTPIDTDNFLMEEIGGLFKKLNWANLKATLKTYFDTLYVTLSGNQTVGGIKTFTSSPIVPTPTTNTQAANKQYADLKVALSDFTGGNASFGGNGYQKLPNGLIIQWGTYSGVLGHSISYTATLPLAFPNYCIKVLTQYGNTPVSTLSGVGYAKIEARSNSSFTFQWGWYSGGSAQVSVDYIAIGY